MLSVGDFRNISRDPLLLLSFAAPLLIAVVLKLGLPFAAGIAGETVGVDHLTRHYPFIISLALTLVPMMLGMLIGFIILDDRDENLLAFYAVTPVSKVGYLLHRVTVPVVLSFVLSLLMIAITGLVPVNYLTLIPVLLMASLQAPLIALFLGAFAANKIEGLALAKALGILLLAPFPGYLLDSPWQLLAGVFPPYWVSKAFMAGLKPSPLFGTYLAAGLVLQASYGYLLLQRFNQKDM